MQEKSPQVLSKGGVLLGCRLFRSGPACHVDLDMDPSCWGAGSVDLDVGIYLVTPRPGCYLRVTSKVLGLGLQF